MQNTFQKWIFDEINNSYVKKSEAVEALCSLLSVGKDSVYRRIRGETILTPEELELLAKTYHISLDKYIYKKTDTVFFTYSPFEAKNSSFDTYLNRIRRNVDTVAALPNCHFKYASPETPLFYLCCIPELIAFKLYIWGRTIWDFDYLQEKKFDFDIIPYPTLKNAASVFDSYRHIPSTELWSLNLINFSINQIEYYMSSAVFADDTIALTLCDKLIELLDHMEQMAKHGTKFKPGGKPEGDPSNFTLYHNEMLYTEHTIVGSSDLGKVVFATFGNPNFIKSTDQRIANYTDAWFDKILTKSQSISTNAEKTRKWFFNRLRRKVSALKTRIENQFEYE